MASTRAGMLVLLLVGVVFSTGCGREMVRLSERALPLARFKPKLPDARPDVVELHYIFLEADAGDPKINDEVWSSDADEQAIPLDVKAALAQNGIRIGKIGTRLSPSLLELLQSQKDNQTGRCHHATSGQLAKIEMTPVIPTWSLFQVVDGQAVGDQIQEGQGFLFVTPTIEGESMVSMEIVPEIEYGPRQQKRVPTPDLAGWQLKTDREARKFPALRTTLGLASGEYAILGTWPDKTATVGHKMFVKEVKGKQRQTLLLVRAMRPNREELLTAGYDFDDFFLTPIRRLGAERTTPVFETVMAAKERSNARVQ